MRILWLTNGFPFPLTSGYLRHYFLIRELSRRHDVTLLSIVGAGFREEDVRGLAPFTERVLTFRSTSRGRPLVKKAVNQIRSWLGADAAVRAMQATVEELARVEPFDAVFCGKRTLAALDPLPHVPLVADMCDATTARIRGSLRYSGLLRVPLLVLEHALVQHTERRMMRRAAHSVFVSSRDREAVLGRSTERTTVMPNGVDLEFWKRSVPERGRDTIVFTGAMNYRPNTDAALYLIEEILPEIQRNMPSARLAIVGRDPTPALVEAGRARAVQVTGFVDDVRPYLDHAAVFAAPLRFGAGIQNKVLEAMAMELPVVASPIAADGLRTAEGERPPIGVARNTREFAESIVAVLEETAKDPSPDVRARSFEIENNFVWSVSAEKLERIFQEITGAPGVTPEPEASCSPSR